MNTQLAEHHGQEKGPDEAYDEHLHSIAEILYESPKEKMVLNIGSVLLLLILLFLWVWYR